jgi:hypothetical protein
MALADMLPGRLGLAGRLPARIEDLRGPSSGVVKLPRNLSWPGMRECDVGDDRVRRSLYGILLAQGNRNDVARLVNAALLRQDWPLIRNSLDRRLARWCERRFGLAPRGRSRPAADGGAAGEAGPAADPTSPKARG